jgi:glutathione S-transferase
VHPLGQVARDHRRRRTVAESGAIVEYLLDTYGATSGLRPAGHARAAPLLYWLHFAEGSAMPPLRDEAGVPEDQAAPMPFFAKPIARGIADKVLARVHRPEPAAPDRLHGGQTRERPLCSRVPTSAPPTSR